MFRAITSLVLAGGLYLTLFWVAHAQAPIVIDAVDDDPANRLFSCDTARALFGNQDTDRSRCLTFRYDVPPGGIQSATLHLAIDTLGSLQETDATAVAVAKPVDTCAWGFGAMPGCVVLHGGFKGEEKSLNLDLMNIACDTTVPNTPENQQLVLDELASGVLHVVLQDDTAVSGAQLVLNGGPLKAPCGTSEELAASFVPTPASAGTIQGAAARTFPFEREVNQFLTGTPEPRPPDQSGAAVAAVAGALALALFAVVNYFLASGRFAATGSSTVIGGTRDARDVSSNLTGATSRDTSTLPVEPQSIEGRAGEVAGTRATAAADAGRDSSAVRGSQRDASPVASDSFQTEAFEPVPMAKETPQAMGASGAPGASPASGASAVSGAPGAVSVDASAGMGTPSLQANSGAGVGALNANVPASGDFVSDAMDAAVKEGIGTVPDASELVKDKLIADETRREKRKQLLADRERFQALLVTQQTRLNDASSALKRAIDRQSDYDAAEREWQHAGHAFKQTRAELDRIEEQLRALEAKE